MATYKGNLFSKTPPTTSTGGAVGIWRAVDLMQAVYAGTWPATYVPVTNDTYWGYVPLLLAGEGTNAAQNNTFLDSSPAAVSMTRTGTTTQGTFTPYSSYWSAYFDGSGDTIYETVSSTQLTLTADWTIEFWVNTSQTARCDVITPNYAYNQTGWFLISFGYTSISGSSASLDYVETGGGSAKITGTIVRNGTWQHIALTRSGTSIRMFLNGTQVGSTYTSSQTQWGSSGNSFLIGNQNASSVYYEGLLSNLRVLKGTALYTTNFTPPTSPLTAITNTALLICNSNRFVDGSTNALALTVTGDTSIQPRSPFNFSASYSAATNGGSMYSTASSDYLTAAIGSGQAFGTGDFTVECWVYPYTVALDVIVSSSGANSWKLLTYGSQLFWQENGGNLGGAGYGSVPNGAWTHLAVSRTSGTIRLFVNGVVVYSAANTFNYSATPTRYIGPANGGTSGAYYLADVRILNGTSAYTAAFTPPTAPTSSTGSALSLKFTNGGVIDNTLVNDLQTVGTAQIGTGQFKFGTSSLYFPAKTDYLSLRASKSLGYLGADFTIECWVYPTDTSLTSLWGVFDARSGTGASAWYCGLASYSSGWLMTFNNGTSYTGTTRVQANTWTFLTWVRSGTTLTFYVNGTAGGTATISGAIDAANTTGTMYVGNKQNATAGYGSIGYIDDLRITNGYARYTGNFSVPSQAFPTA